MHQRPKGYTLLEVIVVLSIIFAVSICIPPMLQWMRMQGVRHALEQLQADLQMARVLAIQQKQLCTVRFNTPGSNQYTNTANGRKTDLSSYRGGVHFLSHGPDGRKMATEVNFNRQGMSSSVVPTDIFLCDGNRLATYRIRILLPGGISIGRWDGKGWRY